MPLREFVCPSCAKKIEYLVMARTFPRILCTCGTQMDLVPSAPNFTVGGFNAKNGYSSKD